MARLPYAFYHRPCDQVARDLVGKVIVRGQVRLRLRAEPLPAELPDLRKNCKLWT